MRVALVLIAGIFAVSACTPHGIFRYEHRKSFNEDSCRMCYGDDCTMLAQSRCDYYVEIGTILDGEQEEGQESELDEMVYDLVEQATRSWTNMECLPLISAYTDCTKDNICLGCKTCECSSNGRWSCKKEQRCRPQSVLDVDQQVLDNIIDHLEHSITDVKSIQKRSIKNETVNKTTLNEIAEWMYGVTPTYDKMEANYNKTTSYNGAQSLVQSGALSTKSIYSNNISTYSPTPEPDYLDFEDVLKNIANEGKNYRRRKPQLQDNNNTEYNTEDIELMKYNDSEKFLDVLNAIEEGNDIVTESVVAEATFIVDLFAKNGKERKEVNNDTDDIMNIINKELKNTIDNDGVNHRMGTDSIKKKRDVTLVNNTSTTEAIIANVTTTEVITTAENELNNTVLIPLTNIIDDKQNELKDLMQIKENLLKYMQNKNDNIDIKATTEHVLLNGSNTYFSIYKLDLIPDISTGFRRNNKNIVNKLLIKLKRDIYEVRRDIAVIQKVSETKDLPYDLKILINAMTKYNHRQRNSLNVKDKNLKLDKNHIKILRRNNDNSDKSSAASIENKFIDILKVLKNNMPQVNVMEIISRDAKKIIKRIIHQHYVVETLVDSLRLIDNEYNLTDDLKSIGNSWVKLTTNVENSPPSEMLYALKLLHVTLVKDINKINDAISLIDFARNRRMILIESPGDKVLDKINNGLDSIKNKVETIIKYRNRTLRMNMTTKTTSKITKKTFMEKLRNLLSSSKNIIVDLLSKNITKSEIIRTIAKKKLEELNQNRIMEHEKTMLRWQNII